MHIHGGLPNRLNFRRPHVANSQPLTNSLQVPLSAGVGTSGMILWVSGGAYPSHQRLQQPEPLPCAKPNPLDSKTAKRKMVMEPTWRRQGQMTEQERVFHPGLGGGYCRKVDLAGHAYMRRTFQADHWVTCVEQLAQGGAGGGRPQYTRV